MSKRERRRLLAAVDPFLKILAKLPERPRPVTPASYWHTPVMEIDGEVLCIGHFAALAELVYVDFDSPITDADIALARKVAEWQP